MSSPDGHRDPDALVGALLTASRALVGISARSLGEVEEHVTLGQFRTLVVLTGHGPTGLGALAARLGVGSSSALRTVDRLIAKGYVERAENPDDRRQVVITASRDGRSLVDEVTARRRAALAEVVAQMPAAGRDALVAALETFADAAGEPDAETDSATLLGW